MDHRGEEVDDGLVEACLDRGSRSGVVGNPYGRAVSNPSGLGDSCSYLAFGRCPWNRRPYAENKTHFLR